jgi:hypothetical protein
MKNRETKQVELEKWLNGDIIQALMSTIEPPNDGREEDVFTDEEYHFAEKAFDYTVEEMRYYDFEQSKQGEKDEFAIFFQKVWELFESKIKVKKMTLNYNSEVFS